MPIMLKRGISILLIPIVLIVFSVFTSCDPHRSGSVIKGANAKSNRHYRPASSKAPRKKKY